MDEGRKRVLAIVAGILVARFRCLLSHGRHSTVDWIEW